MTPDTRREIAAVLRVLAALLRERPELAPLRAWEVEALLDRVEREPAREVEP